MTQSQALPLCYIYGPNGVRTLSHHPEHRPPSTEQPIVEERKKAFLVQTNISGPEKILLFNRFLKNRCKNIDGCCNKVTKTGFMFCSLFFFLFFFPLRFKIFCCSWRRIVFAFFRNAKHVRWKESLVSVSFTRCSLLSSTPTLKLELSTKATT